MADTDHTPSKQKQSLSFQLWDGTICCVRSALEEDNIITFISLIMQQQAVFH